MEIKLFKTWGLGELSDYPAIYFCCYVDRSWRDSYLKQSDKVT